jgi:hypothetical protein
VKLPAAARERLGKVRHAYRGRGLPRVHFLHVGKTGGTAVKAALRPVATAGPYRLDLHGHTFRLAQVGPDEQFFFATRDPVDRFVSAFYSRRRGGAPPSRVPWSPAEALAFRQFATANELAARIDSDAAARAAMGAIVHIRDHYSAWFVDPDGLLARRDALLAILRLEHLDDDFPPLVARLGLEGRAELPRDERRAHRGPSAVDTSLSEHAVDNLRAWYADDYAFLEVCTSIAQDLDR